MISILLNSRSKDYDNDGNVSTFLDSLSSSLYDKKNVEVIFKFDIDDEIVINQFIDSKKIHPDLQLKGVITPRYFYKGLHLGYYECFKLIDKKSKIVICMADDFLFSQSNWDLNLLNKISSFSLKDIYTVQNFIGNNLNMVPISPMWSPKLIEICEGFGPVFATDAWSLKINEFLQKTNPQNVILYDIGVKRKGCEMDSPSHPRWNTDRAYALNYLNSKEFKDKMNTYIIKLKEYLNYEN